MVRWRAYLVGQSRHVPGILHPSRPPPSRSPTPHAAGDALLPTLSYFLQRGIPSGPVATHSALLGSGSVQSASFDACTCRRGRGSPPPLGSSTNKQSRHVARLVSHACQRRGAGVRSKPVPLRALCWLPPRLPWPGPHRVPSTSPPSPWSQSPPAQHTLQRMGKRPDMMLLQDMAHGYVPLSVAPTSSQAQVARRLSWATRCIVYRTTWPRNRTRHLTSKNTALPSLSTQIYDQTRIIRRGWRGGRLADWVGDCPG